MSNLDSMPQPQRDDTAQEAPRYSRRVFLNVATQALALGAAAWAAPGAWAEELTRTPPQTEGPFYPDHLPLDSDNDLLIIKNHATPALGAITHLSGRILDARGNPLKNARIEIWQVDHSGAYIHSGDGNKANQDKNFQGFGRFETGKSGEYRFRTIKPVPYPGRTPHIHVKIWKGETPLLTTQLYVRGEPMNERDGVYRGIRDPKARELVTVDFAPLKNSRIGELSAHCDIVLGVTPQS